MRLNRSQHASMSASCRGQLPVSLWDAGSSGGAWLGIFTGVMLATGLACNYDPFGDTSKLRVLTVAQAETLIDCRTNLLLDGLTSVSPEVAQVLGGHEKGMLFLRGLKTLSPEVAAALANHTQGAVFLDGLTTLLPETATPLALHKGDLILSGVTELSPEAARAIVSHLGRLYLRSLQWELVSDETIEVLKKNEQIELPVWAYEQPQPRKKRRRR